MMVRVRTFPEANYKAVFTPSGKTAHFKLDNQKPFKKLPYPEILDVAINSWCAGGCSDYCYVAATKNGVHFENIVEKAHLYWGNMTLEQRPLQIAIGGGGEPTAHPDFPEFLKAVKELGIMPNYTTNGMHLSKRVLDATEKYAGGVAVTCHNHLEKYWSVAIDKLKDITRLNLHLIPRSKEDVDKFVEIFDKYNDSVEYFVLLPYQAVGFGKELDMSGTYQYLFDEVLFKMSDRSQIAYGAFFREELEKHPWLKANIYDEQIFSGYLVMEGTGYLCKSSYEWENPVKTDIFQNI